MRWKVVLALLMILSTFVVAVEYPTAVKVLLSTELSSWGSNKGYTFEKVDIKSARPFIITSDNFEKTFTNGEIILSPDGDKVHVKIKR